MWGSGELEEEVGSVEGVGESRRWWCEEGRARDEVRSTIETRRLILERTFEARADEQSIEGFPWGSGIERGLDPIETELNVALLSYTAQRQYNQDISSGLAPKRPKNSTQTKNKGI